MLTKKPARLILSALTFVSQLFSSCMGQPKKTDEKFDWTGTISAPQEYPVEIYEGRLAAADYDHSFKDWGIVNSGWGNTSGTVVSGDRLKFLPDTLALAWLSFVEKKFYSGNFVLAKDKITALFKQGIHLQNGKKEPYGTVIIGLAPQGNITVWIEGTSQQTLVAQFVAKEITITPESVLPHDKYMFRPGYMDRVLKNDMIITPEIASRIKSSGYPDPNNYSIAYNKKFLWKPVFDLPDNAIPELFSYALFNGEREDLFDALRNQPLLEQAVLKSCYFRWKASTGEEHAVKVVAFDEKELLSAFEVLGKNAVQLRFSVIKGEILISLKNELQEIVLRNQVVQSY